MLITEHLGVRSCVDLRVDRERPIDGYSGWFVDLRRGPRPCAETLTKHAQVEVLRVPIDGMLGDECHSIATSRSCTERLSHSGSLISLLTSLLPYVLVAVPTPLTSCLAR